MKRPFHGRGRVQIASRGEDILIRVQLATTQTRKLKTEIRQFLRKEAAHVRPHFAPFEVRIWTSLMEERGQMDVDNIAKACLDALNGIVWRDDRQVYKLISEKFTGPKNEIAIRARPLDIPCEPIDLDENLLDF